MFKLFILAFLATQVLCNQTQIIFSSKYDYDVDCGSGFKYSSTQMCDENIYCPNDADKLECPQKKFKPFICGRGIKLSFQELCLSNSSCPNHLDKFVCETHDGISKKFMEIRDSGFVMLNKYDLCTSKSMPFPSPLCRPDRLADRTIVAYFEPNRIDTFIWMIRDMDEFRYQGPIQFHSPEAFTQEIHLRRWNSTVYILSHPNHYVEFFSTEALAELDSRFCPLRIDEAICSAFPALKNRLLGGDDSNLQTKLIAASSNGTPGMSLLSLCIFLFLSLYFECFKF